MDIAPFLDNVAREILNPLIVLLFAIALLVFFWGLFKFMRSAGSEDGMQEGKRTILYGLIGMFVMFSAYGLIHIILGTFGISEPAYISK